MKSHILNLMTSFVLSSAVYFGLSLTSTFDMTQSAYESATDLIATQMSLQPSSSIESNPAYLSRLTPAQRLSIRLKRSFLIDDHRATQFGEWISEASLREHVPVSLLAALISTESDFRYLAKSHHGAVGPTQVVPRFWSGHCEGNITKDPRANVLCGARVLSRYYDRCKEDLSCALAMYNTGPTATLLSPSSDQDEAMTRYWAKIERALQRFDPALKVKLSHTWRTGLIASNNI
jgi:hypothetical protein